MSDETERIRKPLGKWVGIVAGIILMLLFVGMLIPARSVSYEAGRRTRCMNHMRQIGLALLSYHDAYKCFPPAYVADADGMPMHSWRVLLLPFMEETTIARPPYRFDEPWNSPYNSQFAERLGKFFRCPDSSAPSTSANYVVVVGPGTLWPGVTSTNSNEITDGVSRTIMVVETSNPNIHCLAPRDITIDEAMLGIQPHGAARGISCQHRGGVNMVLADGSVHFLPEDTPPEKLRAMLTSNGDENVELP